MRPVPLAKLIRRSARLVAGAAFWLHALLILPIPHPSFERLFGLTTPETILGLFFLAVSILNGYGFGKFLVDLLYIYFFPFILCYRMMATAARVSVYIPKLGARFFPAASSNFTWKLVLMEMMPDASRYSFAGITSPDTTSPVLTFPVEPTRNVKAKRRILVKLALPLKAFTTAWGLVIVLSDRTPFVLFAVIVLSIHTLVFVTGLARRLSDATKFFADAETRLVDYTTRLFELVMNTPEENIATPDVNQASSILGLMRGASFLIINRADVSYVFLLVACLTYAVTYARISLFFGFLYVGIAKLNHLPLSFLDSMVNSLAMPLSYTNFPKHWILQLVQDLHSLVVILLGFGAVSTYLRRKVESFRDIADSLWAKLDAAEVRERMARASRRPTATTRPAARAGE